MHEERKQQNKEMEKQRKERKKKAKKEGRNVFLAAKQTEITKNTIMQKKIRD